MAKISPYVAIPPIMFLGLAGLFYFGLSREDANNLPSTMVGRDAPAFLKITELRDDPAPTIDDLTVDGIKFVNFWASWCGPCRAEHPLLEAMADDGANLIGINYKDSASNALGFLAELGDPFTKIGADTTGRTGLEWGVYGVPETFVIDGNGKVLYRHAGPLTQRIMDERVLPAIAAASQ
ncbi:MAG: DsbE family thiol:disulfide interchange protein [Rhodobacteraceae bacterium]|nr:DsbE family thiol:disulfide interchange protein [Paracoccaceae bacterium]